MTAWDISSARLVTLSACETGITDIVKGSADEFVGLPASFMLTGVPCVVSSLWLIPDIPTFLLMERFYFNHVAEEWIFLWRYKMHNFGSETLLIIR